MGRNPCGFLTRLAVAGAIAGLALISRAEDAPQKTDAPPAQSSVPKKPMKMNEPMAGEMMKPGMMKGDMKKSAEKKDRDMKDEMEKEEKAMKK